VSGQIALVRATHLNDYISVLRDIGAPVDRDLARSKLPPNIEEALDLYVSVPVAIEWVARAGRDLDPMELGLLGARHASLASLRPADQAALAAAPTALTRLAVFGRICRSEDSVLELHVRQEADAVRVICNMSGLRRHPNVCFAEWLNLQGAISVMRSFAGPSWYPTELCFASTKRVPEAVRAAFPNTRILVGRPRTSLVVGRADLARRTTLQSTPEQDAPVSAGPACEPDRDPEVWEFVGLLRRMLQPYLYGARPDVAFAAEMSGVSTRTLQRRLKLCGSSYSQILQEARFGLARARLEDPSVKVIDVAMTAGYESPQHFTRAFRRFTGCTPSEYRRHHFGETDARNPM
jgi:AraC-like DNA-binding protein